jgi:hypothetical protein
MVRKVEEAFGNQIPVNVDVQVPARVGTMIQIDVTCVVQEIRNGILSRALAYLLVGARPI